VLLRRLSDHAQGCAKACKRAPHDAVDGIRLFFDFCVETSAPIENGVNYAVIEVVAVFASDTRPFAQGNGLVREE
jgi:hypothetical protein